MEKIRKVYIPSTTIAFTLVVLWTSAGNVMNGIKNNGYGIFILQLFVYLIAAQACDILLSKIEFKSYLSYFLTEAGIFYGIMLLFAYFGKWFPFQIKNLVGTTVMFFAVCVYVHYYFYKIRKAEADEINRLLEERSVR